jgi:DNA-binding IclR family transcriptional regulator
VYEALEHTREPVRSFDLTTVTGLSRSAVHEALETLSAFNLAAQHGGRWIMVAGTDLAVLAEQLGVTEIIDALVRQHREERAAYRLVLQIADRHTTVVAGARWFGAPEPPSDPGTETALEVLQRILGAYPIPA